MRTLAPYSLVLVVLGTSLKTHAGGFASARFGGSHGNPTTDNPTAIYYNPAGLALRQGTRIFVEGLFAYRSATYDRPSEAIDTISNSRVGTPTEAVDANSGAATISNLVTSPFIGVVSDFGVPNLAVGGAIFVPFGGQSSWNKNTDYSDSEKYPGAVDGVQRWSTIEGTIRALYLSAATAYHVPAARLRFGLSANVVRQEVNTVRARNATGSDDLVTADGQLVEGRSWVDTSGTHLALGVGVIWEPVPNTWLGLSYQSAPGFGETSQSGTLSTQFGATDGEVSNVHLHQELPDVVRIGVRNRIRESLELRASADYTRWSTMQDQCLTDSDNDRAKCSLTQDGGFSDDAEGVIVNVHRDWQDTFGVRGAVSYWLVPELETFGDLSYDSNAVPDATIDAGLMDFHKIIGILGARYPVTDHILLSASYTHFYYISRSIDPRMRDENGNAAAPPPPSRVPDGAGDYSQWIGLLNLGAEIQF